MISNLKRAGELVRAQTLRVDVDAHTVNGRLTHAQQQPTPSVEVYPWGYLIRATGTIRPGQWSTPPPLLSSISRHLSSMVYLRRPTRQHAQRTIPRRRVHRGGARSDAAGAAACQNGRGTWAHDTGEVG